MRYFIVFFSLLIVFSCKGQKEKTILQEYSYLNDKRPIYLIGLSIPGPYELYINDIAAEKDYSPSAHGLWVDVNPYVLKSGKYKFKLRKFPMPSELEKGGIQPGIADIMNISFGTGEKNQEQKFPRIKPGTDKVIKWFSLPTITMPVPYLDIEGEFEVELPYALEGWENGQDLSKMDKKVLEDKVVKYYRKLWEILNAGNGDEWTRLTTKRQYETAAFDYNTQEEFETAILDNKKNIEEKCKGMMVPLEDYEMKIYGEGKLVTLERKSHTQSYNNKDRLDIKGWSPLIRKGKKSGAASYSVLLYLPQNSDEFEIIRK